MKEGKAKIAVCKENSRDVLECLLFQNSTVPSSVFSAFVYDGWCDSESSINSGGKAADTIKIADFLLIFTLEWLLSSSFLMFAFCTCTS